MPRKRSAETELRHVKRELRERREEIDKLREVGNGLANICLHFANINEPLIELTDDGRASLKEAKQEWDAIPRTTRNQ